MMYRGKRALCYYKMVGNNAGSEVLRNPDHISEKNIMNAKNITKIDRSSNFRNLAEEKKNIYRKDVLYILLQKDGLYIFWPEILGF